MGTADPSASLQSCLGVEWDVAQAGEASRGAALVLLSGPGEGAGVFAAQLDAFKDCTVVIGLAPSRGSDRDRVVPSLAALFDRLALDRLDLLGASGGAWLAQQWAAQEPHRVRRLVLANAMPQAAAWPPGHPLHGHQPREPLADPAALIDCEDDPLVGPRVRLSLRRRYPHARVYSLSAGGHRPQQVVPHLFNQILQEEFLER